MADIEIVVSHRERTTLRVGELFLKIDSDPDRLAAEVAAMALATIPTPEIRWHQPPVLALAALPGRALGRLGAPSPASAAAWTAAGAALRTLHDAPLPPRPGPTPDELAGALADGCAWLVDHDVLPAALVQRNRLLAERVLRPWTPAFVHGDLQLDHVFVEGDAVTGVLDWSEARRGDALWDLATLTIGHPERLDELLAGYGRDVDREVVRGWWSWRALTNARWLIEHGFDPNSSGGEFDALRSAR